MQTDIWTAILVAWLVLLSVVCVNTVIKIRNLYQVIAHFLLNPTRCKEIADSLSRKEDDGN